MAALRTMEDFIRQRMVAGNHRRLSVTLRNDGRFEASVVHADGRTATCEVDDDPATALWNCLVPFQMRRRLPSGREIVPGDRPLLIPEPEIDLLASDQSLDLLADEELDLLS